VYLLSPYLLANTNLHIWLDAVDCRPELSLVAKKLSGLGGLSLSGSVMLGQKYVVGDALRLCVPEVHRGDLERANVVLRDMHRAPVVFDATQRNADFVTAEEEWCWRSSYIVSLIAIAANKAGSIIVCVATKGQTETLADELRSSGRARHARLGWALPAGWTHTVQAVVIGPLLSGSATAPEL